MYPPIKRPAPRQNKITRKSVISFLRLVVLLITGCALAVMLANSRSARSSSSKRAPEVIIRTTDHGRTWLKMQPGHSPQAQSLGTAGQTDQLKWGTTRPLTLATGDLDQDGAPDVLAGYATPSGGIITIQRGNIDAFAPREAAVFQAIQQGRMPASLTASVSTFSVPDAPDFLQVGDFNGDGAPDVVAGARGAYRFDFLAGDGLGGLEDARQVDLSGFVTAMTTGYFSRGDHLSIAVGVDGANGPAVVRFGSVWNRIATSYSLPAATSLTFAQLD